MSNFTEAELRAFKRELEKNAAPWRSLLGGLGSGAALGATLGGGLTAAHGAVKGYREAREAGGSGLGGAALGAIGGAGKGALIGAGLGAAGGAGLGALRPGLIQAASKAKGPVGSISRFGQRQLHGFTGWTPTKDPKSIRDIGGGAAPALKRFEQASAATGPKAAKELARAKKGLQAAEEAEAMGLTSLPGYAKSFVKNPGKTVTTGLKEQWAGQGPVGKAMMVGFPAMSVGGALVGPETPETGGKGERLLANLGTLPFYMGPVPLGAQMALGTGMESAGRLLGKGVDKLRGKPKRAPVNQPRLLPPHNNDGELEQAQVGDTIVGPGVLESGIGS